MAASVTTASGASWQAVAADRQRHRDATIAAADCRLPVVEGIPLNTTSIAKQILTPEEIQITESLVEDLLPRLATGDIDSLTVTKAFLRRAALAQQATNCVTELLPERAFARAAFLDEYLKTHGKPIGPLHGLPITVKEHLAMKGLDLNAGFVSWVGRIADKDSLILEILWKAGAVFYVRTTQPQTLMHLETSNNIYGVTTNPFNTTLTPGGSSGGEGAIIGFRGACLGIGTDIGGSIRSPAANNGLYGVKPTAGRLPVTGCAVTMVGEEQIVATIGPLSTSLEGCKLFIKTIIDSQPWNREPSLFPFPWKTEDFFTQKKLKVAVLWDDGVVKVHPPVTRALKQVVEKLKGQENIDIVEWKPWKHDLAWEIIANLYFSDGAEENKAAINASSEPMLPLTKHILENQYVERHTISSVWAATRQREAYRASYASLWNKTATSVGPNGELEGMVDVILCPAGPGAAPKLGTTKWWGYTSQWNLLDYPAIVFPVDKVEVEKDEIQGNDGVEYEGRNERDRENWALWKEHGAKGYEDAPVSLQLVARKFEDEKMIQALEIIKKAAGFPYVEYV